MEFCVGRGLGNDKFDMKKKSADFHPRRMYIEKSLSFFLSFYVL